MIELVFHNFLTDRRFGKTFFLKILKKAAPNLNPKLSQIEVSVNLVGKAKIKLLNNRYRSKNKVADVLSFPLSEKSPAGYDMMPIGDIFICLPFAKKQAKSENTSIEKKLAQLTVHGFLHLMGYDHEKSRQEAEEMFALEEKILQ